MRLSKEAIEEFKEIWKKEYKEDISDEKARRVATGLLELYSIVYGYDIDLESVDIPDAKEKK